MKPESETEMEQLRSIVKDQASQLEILSAQLASAMRSNKQLLEANIQLSIALTLPKIQKQS